MTLKTGWLVAGIALLVLGVVVALSTAPPDDGLDHGGNPCSAALFEALGIGSNDSDSNARAGGESSVTKGTIAYCREAARERIALAGGILAAGAAVVVVGRRLRSGPSIDVDVP